MKVRLLFPEENARWNTAVPDWEDRFSDFNLSWILKAMSKGDPNVSAVCRQMLDQPLQTREEILYRQDILKECIRKPEAVEHIYEICLDAEEKRRNTWCRLTSPHLSTVYSSGAELLKIYMEALVEIRRILEREAFRSAGLKKLTDLLKQELSDAYLEEVRTLQYGIGDQDGMLISADFGRYLQGISYVKRQPNRGISRLRWIIQPSYTLSDHDTKGEKDLELRQDRAINEVANVMAQAAGSLQCFADQLRMELAFYIGGIHLHQRFSKLHLNVCFPEPVSGKERFYRGLYDGSLALLSEASPVGNALAAEGKNLVLITGANQGGKTTFLRSVGICQLMAQCGLFVCAEQCRFPLRTQIFTHFCREEDHSMNSGKLDEELSRMSCLIDQIKPGAMLLSNESFSSTNDRDGSEIFIGIVQGLLEQDIEIFAVTHLTDFAQFMASREDVLSLRPERTDTGERTFRLVEEAPSPEAYAEDIYRKVFHEP